MPRSLLEIADHLGYRQRKSVRLRLLPLVKRGRLAMTLPEKPNSRFQKYVAVR